MVGAGSNPSFCLSQLSDVQSPEHRHCVRSRLRHASYCTYGPLACAATKSARSNPRLPENCMPKTNKGLSYEYMCIRGVHKLLLLVVHYAQRLMCILELSKCTLESLYYPKQLLWGTHDGCTACSICSRFCVRSKQEPLLVCHKCMNRTLTGHYSTSCHGNSYELYR